MTGEAQAPCKPVRVRAADYSENDISFAFSTMKKEGFPETRLVASRTSHDANILLATQAKSYSIDDAMLDWTIMIMTPVETVGGDTLVRGDALFGALVAIASLGFVLCAGLVFLLVKHRTEREVVVSDWRFMSLFVGGCALLNASCLSFLGENTDALCLSRMWLIHFFAVFTLSFLFVKTYRMYKLVGAGMRRTTISHAQTAKTALPFIGLQTLLLLIFTFVDPLKREEIITTEGSDITHRVVCAHDTNAFFFTMLLYEGGMIIVGCVLAFKTRNLRDEFNESKQIILAMYDTAVIGSVVLIVSNTIESYQAGHRILLSLATFWTTCFASLVFVIPRLLQLKNRQRSQHGTNRTTVVVSGLTNYRQENPRNLPASTYAAGTTNSNGRHTRMLSNMTHMSDVESPDATVPGGETMANAGGKDAVGAAAGSEEYAAAAGMSEDAAGIVSGSEEDDVGVVAPMSAGAMGVTPGMSEDAVVVLTGSGDHAAGFAAGMSEDAAGVAAGSDEHAAGVAAGMGEDAGGATAAAVIEDGPSHTSFEVVGEENGRVGGGSTYGRKADGGEYINFLQFLEKPGGVKQVR